MTPEMYAAGFANAHGLQNSHVAGTSGMNVPAAVFSQLRRISEKQRNAPGPKHRSRDWKLDKARYGNATAPEHDPLPMS
jgi:hypothetical protein